MSIRAHAFCAWTPQFFFGTDGGSSRAGTMEDPLIATITVQNSKSVFRMQFNFEENSAVSVSNPSFMEFHGNFTVMVGDDFGDILSYTGQCTNVLGIFMFLRKLAVSQMLGQAPAVPVIRPWWKLLDFEGIERDSTAILRFTPLRT